ncbi:WD-40 repeat [Micractinium conductrix]|uniref:WD-40 repeat n=1 Tax=Micractinium conductrix TaxID=554055 RepID=A0A2P6VBQ4_9CHLO|nr:WD-40 repeat [Micractinium conductrix]|eukprot:PSC71527.1 WD-40 repeat [Micractinium conductrix]
MAGHPDEMPDFADPEHGVPRLTEHWAVEMEEAAVALALSPKGQLLAVGTVDDAISVLDVSSGKVAHSLPGHKGGTNRLTFLGGNSLASVGEDGTARIWNVARGTCVHELSVDAEGADRVRGGCSVNHLTVAPGSKSFACAAGSLVSVFTLGDSAAAPPTKRVLGPLPSTVEHLRYDRAGNLLACYNGGCSMIVADRKAEQDELPMPYAGACLCGDVSPGGEYVVAGCHDATVHIFQLKAQRDGSVEMVELSCGGYDSKVTVVDFNLLGDRMASAGGDKNTIWNFSGPPTGSMPTLAIGHFGAITCQAWQPDLEGWLATAAKDGRLYVYDTEASAKLGPDMPFIVQPGIIGLTDDEDEVTALVFARDGLLYTGHISGTVRKWELPLESSSEEEEEVEEAKEGPAATAAEEAEEAPAAVPLG